MPKVLFAEHTLARLALSFCCTAHSCRAEFGAFISTTPLVPEQSMGILGMPSGLFMPFPCGSVRSVDCKWILLLVSPRLPGFLPRCYQCDQPNG